MIVVFVVLVGSGFSRIAVAQTTALPELTEPVNDFAHVIDPENAAAIDKMSRALKAASGDVVVVATVPNIDGYGDIREYANKLFENHGKGIGDKGKDNGLLIVLALKERQVWVEVGYELEQWITDGFAGETSRISVTSTRVLKTRAPNICQTGMLIAPTRRTARMPTIHRTRLDLASGFSSRWIRREARSDES